MPRFDKKKIYDKAIKYASEKELIFITEVVTYMPCGNTTFYTLFPENSEELDNIKEILEQNRVDLKRMLRKKMFKEGKSADNIVLYKLAGTKEEREILNGVDPSTNEVKPTQTININYVKPDNEK